MSTLTIYPRFKLIFVSSSTYTVLLMLPPPPRNDTGLESAVGKARLKEKYKSAWKFERYGVAFLDLCKPSLAISLMSSSHAFVLQPSSVCTTNPRPLSARLPIFSSLAHMSDGGVSQSRWSLGQQRSKGS